MSIDKSEIPYWIDNGCVILEIEDYEIMVQPQSVEKDLNDGIKSCKVAEHHYKFTKAQSIQFFMEAQEKC